MRLRSEAADAFAQMAAFLGMERPVRFTEADRESIRRDAAWLAECVYQMDGGRGKSHDLREIDFPVARLMVGIMRLAASGKLDEIEVDERSENDEVCAVAKARDLLRRQRELDGAGEQA